MSNAEQLSGAKVEPWLRGTRQQVPSVVRAVLHALDLAQEDFRTWVWPIPEREWEETPFGLPSVAYQARHVARSLDRLLTYAEGRALSEAQHALLQEEHAPAAADKTKEELGHAFIETEQRVLALPVEQIEDTRYVGQAKLAVSLGGLLVHIADHTQRHAGQAVTTAKILLARRDA